MSGATSDFAVMQFSTEALPERERVAAVCDFVGPVVARLEINSLVEGPSHFAITARAVPDLAVATLAFSAIRGERTRALMADGNDNCSLSFLHSPGNSVIYRGREVLPSEGTGTLLSMADPFVCATLSGIAHGMTISVPRKVLMTSVPQLEDRFGHIVPDTEAPRLLRNYLGVLEQEQSFADPELRRLVVAHVHDLVALALGASRDAAEIAKARGLRAARLYTIKADIRASLGQQALSLTAIAARHGVSPRYVQTLFESDGTTFSRFLISERLARAHHMLCDPRQTGRSISALAYAAGFSDLSYFNRAFRRCYGTTPSDVRAAATRERSG
jgi:AraC-like DNA-binding protein